jgi:hypothetical protein
MDGGQATAVASLAQLASRDARVDITADWRPPNGREGRRQRRGWLAAMASTVAWG